MVKSVESCHVEYTFITRGSKRKWILQSVKLCVLCGCQSVYVCVRVCVIHSEADTHFKVRLRPAAVADGAVGAQPVAPGA